MLQKIKRSFQFICTTVTFCIFSLEWSNAQSDSDKIIPASAISGYCSETKLSYDQNSNELSVPENTGLPSGWYLIFGLGIQPLEADGEYTDNAIISMGARYQQRIYGSIGAHLGINWEVITSGNMDFKLYPGFSIGGWESSKQYKVCYISPEFNAKSDGSQVTGLKYTGTRLGLMIDFKSENINIDGFDVSAKMNSATGPIYPEVALKLYFGPIKGK
jgi:hypothetical protein